MTISTIRRATEEDYEAIETAAERFCKRHGLTPDPHETFAECVEFSTEQRNSWDDVARALRPLWIGCYCRALKQPRDRRLTIGWGYVGIEID